MSLGFAVCAALSAVAFHEAEGEPLIRVLAAVAFLYAVVASVSFLF